MLRLVALCLCLGLARSWICCSTEDIRELQRTWHFIWSYKYTGHRVQVAQAIFADLFEHHPETKAAFTRVNVDHPDSPEFRAHCIRVVNGLDTMFGLMDDGRAMDHHMNHLGAQHAAREGVKVSYFDYMAGSIQRVLPQVASCFNAGAWNRCFDQLPRVIADHMHRRRTRLGAEAD